MTRSADEILGREAVAAVRRPIEQARGLPAAAYTSEEFFRLEQRKYFARTWMGVAYTCDIPDPGDVMPITVAGLPIVLVRTRDGEIKAFHNVCRHRAAMVVTEPRKNATRLQCPYHAWAWDLDGGLRAAPYFDGSRSGLEEGLLKREALGLVPAPCAAWHHWIFVNLDGNAPPIEEHMRPLAELMNGAGFGATRVAERVDWEYRANWKMSNDNWENYHHMWAHYPIYTKVTDDLDMKTRKPWSVPLQKGAVMTLKRDSKKAPPYPKRESNLPMIPFPEGAERVTAPNLVLPNVEITVVRDNIGSVITEPLAPDRSVARMAFFFVGEAATAPRFEAGRKLNFDRWLGESRSAPPRATACATRTCASGNRSRSPGVRRRPTRSGSRPSGNPTSTISRTTCSTTSPRDRGEAGVIRCRRREAGCRRRPAAG